MVEGVVAHLMAGGDNLLEQFGVFPDVVTHHEERGVGIVCGQGLTDEWGGVGPSSKVR